jgi:hypothetical protein
VDCVFNALVSPAAADVAGHSLFYLTIGGLWIFQEQGRGLHDLPGLAITALRHIQLSPRFLNRMIAGRMKAFNGCDFPIGNIGHGRNAGAYGLLIDDNGACTAQSLAAAEFRTGQSDLVAKKPKQRKIRIAVPSLFLSVDFQFGHDRPSLFISYLNFSTRAGTCFLWRPVPSSVMVASII